MIPFPPHPSPTSQDGVQTPTRVCHLSFAQLSDPPIFSLAIYSFHTGFYFIELLGAALTHHVSSHLHAALCAPNPTAPAAPGTPCSGHRSTFHSVFPSCVYIFVASIGLYAWEDTIFLVPLWPPHWIQVLALSVTLKKYLLNYIHDDEKWHLEKVNSLKVIQLYLEENWTQLSLIPKLMI